MNERKTMKKLMMLASVAAVAGMLAGCFTSATAYTETKHADGSVTVSKVKVIGTGDKASQIASEGLFADGTAEDLGAGVKTASASQTSTGIDGTLAAAGNLFAQGVQAGMAAYGMRAATAAGVAAAAERGYTYDTDPSYDTAPTGYTGSPGENGIGVYGKSGCGRCAAYAAAHPDIAVIDIGNEQYRKTMWDTLKGRFKFTGTNVNLPVVITADGFTQAAR